MPKNNWLKSIGTGAMVRTGDVVNYEGALFTLQKQATSSIHPGGNTALSLLRKSYDEDFRIDFNVFRMHDLPPS